jgi:outer membrane lipoprotein-sorting protein
MRKFLFVLLAAMLLPVPRANAAEDLKSVLAKLNAAALGFRTTSADFEFDSLTTVPIEDKEVQTGTVYYERTGHAFKMAAHIQKVDGQPVPKTYMFVNGEFKLWEGGNLDQVTTFARGSKYESYLMLGFGASGADLEDKWNITFDGMETVAGLPAAKLELVAKDPEVRKNIPKVTVWMDLARGISLKQVFDEGQGQTRTCTYSNFKLNQDLPKDAFTYKTDKNTQYIKR